MPQTDRRTVEMKFPFGSDSRWLISNNESISGHMPKAFIISSGETETHKLKNKLQKLKMKYCRECASGNQGQNCPAACKGTQGSCACHSDGCCKPGWTI